MYGKIFGQIYDGTLATKGPWQALVTFEQLIILADKHGVVDMTAEAIARRTTIPLEIIQIGLAALEQADPDSRSPDEEGRRIVRLSDTRAWGWRLVNHGHYRKIRSEEERREYHKLYQRDRRARTAEPVNYDVNKSTENQQSQPIAVSSKQDAVGSKQTTPLPPSGDVGIVLTHYGQLHPKRKIVGPKYRSIVEKALKDFSAAELIEAIDGNARDPWHRERSKHELGYVLRDADKINDMRARSGATTLTATDTAQQTYSARWYDFAMAKGFSQIRTLNDHLSRAEDVQEEASRLGLNRFKSELLLVRPWERFHNATNFDRLKNIAQVVLLFATTKAAA